MGVLHDLAKQFYAATKNTVQASNFPDEIALKMPDLYEEWSGDGVKYAEDTILKFGKDDAGETQLYRVIQEHTSQSDRTPDKTASLYTKIDKAHAGTMEDPIPWKTNMFAYKGKYYVEGDLLALCIEDSGIALHNPLKDLCPGRYFEKVEKQG